MLRSGFRLHAVQASWNFERMIGLGIAVAIRPLLKAVSPNGRKGLAPQMARAAGYFNTHPYLAGMAVGAMARAETDGVAPGEMEHLKNALVGPLGSIGDRIIWAGALPGAAALGLMTSSLVHQWYGALVFAIAFNAVHLPLRWWSLVQGWRLGMGVVGALKHPVFRIGMNLSGPVAALLVGLAIPLTAGWLLEDFDRHEAGLALLVAVLGVIVGRWLWPRLGSLWFGLGIAGLTLVLGTVWP